MAQHDSEDPGRSSKAADEQNLTAEGGASPRVVPTESSPQLFEADRAAPESPQSEASQPAEEPAGLAPETAQPKRKAGLTFGRIVLALVALAGAGIGAAFLFRDKDERLQAVAVSIESAVQNPQSLVSGGQEKIAALLGEAPGPAQVAVKEPIQIGGGSLEERSPSGAGSDAAPSQPVEPAPEVKAGPSPAEKPQPAEPAAEAGPPRSKPAASAEQPATPPESKSPSPGPAPMASSENSDRDALLKRVEKIEEIAQSALKTAEAARSSNERADKPETAPLKEGDYLAALEGRIDELASEIRAVRERLDAPKNAARAQPETSEIRGQTTSKNEVAELVVVAQSLHQELEKGKPFATELAALTALGVDSELVAALTPAAQKGALTPDQLLQGFGPVAKRLRAIDAPKSTGSYLEHLATSFGRLIRVRPQNESPLPALSDHVDAIETALKHGDVAAAAQAFEKLPEDVKTEESAFGELLRQRRDSERAAASILSGAISALGRNKS